MIRAIICDDEIASIRILKKLIEAYSIPIQIVGTASNGIDAITLYYKSSPDLVFLDIQMPGRNGFEVIEEIGRANIIIVTAYNLFEYAQRSLRLGVKDILVKPIDYEQLSAAIERALGWKFTQNSLVNRVLEYINKNYMEHITLDELAELCYCSKNHLARVFKAETSQTIIGHLHFVRIRQACEKIKTGELSLEEISIQVGYKNLNAFYYNFKKYIGKTPGEYGREEENEEDNRNYNRTTKTAKTIPVD
ncbi:MAG: response regulator [Tissierellia bacterium]|nr:response regulator [Tissierellia bacterium]